MKSTLGLAALITYGKKEDEKKRDADKSCFPIQDQANQEASDEVGYANDKLSTDNSRGPTNIVGMC